jgi:general secretion pathway protein D
MRRYRNTLLSLALVFPALAGQAKTSKAAAALLAEGRQFEAGKDFDAALERYLNALDQDPSNLLYRMAVEKARFQAAQSHVEKGLSLREAGGVPASLAEFEKAYALNPGSAAALQEVRRTQEMIARAQKATPVQAARQDAQRRAATLKGPARLAPLDPQPVSLKMVNQRPRILFETVCRLARINLLVDPEYQEGKPSSVELEGAPLEEALDHLALLTKSYWRPVSSNTIFLTNDNINKRRDYEEHVTRVFYLSNVNSPQELQEIITTIRSVADLQRVFAFSTQSAIIVRGEADRVALAEKLIGDLDKPRAEVLVDVLVLEANSVMTRKLAAAIAPTGLNVPLSFTPRSQLTTAVTSTDSSSTSTSSTTSSSTSTAVSLAALGHLSSADYSLVLPGAQLQAVLSDARTKVLQAPQIRSIDSQKATLKIGDRQPTATGSYQSAVSTATVNALVNTQFTYIDVGVNVDLTPKVHDNGDVSMHIELEVSSVNGKVNLGGIEEPIIGQRKVIHDVRMREGEVNLLGGLVNQQESKTKTGVPGLSSVPILGRLFSGEEIDRNRGELMIALIPHIIRRPEISPENLNTVAAGSATVVKLSYETPPASRK